MQTELAPILIDGDWRQAEAPAGTINSRNPANGALLPEVYPVSSWHDLQAALAAAQRAVIELRSTPPESIAEFLEHYAEGIEARSDEIIEAARTETGLPSEPRLRAELPRTTNQMRQAAAAARDRSWCQATIDTHAHLASKLSGLGGAVIVIGPNNFPLAFNSISGGDFAAAVAAGNPVIAKAHPGHPRTTRLLAQAAHAALQSTSVPRGLLQMVYHFAPDDGLRLVQHPGVAATAFTGSRRTGLALKAAAEQAGKLIYLEMSSLNPVFILPGALKERLAQVSQELFASCTLGTGQYCTNPGLVIVPAGELGETFVAEAAALFRDAPPGTMLGETLPPGLAASLVALQHAGALVVVGGQPGPGPGYSFQNTLLRVSGREFLANHAALQTEAFGPASLVVLAAGEAELLEIAHSLEGNLTGSIYSETAGADDALYARLEPILRQRVGRLLNDKMPTGLAVSPAMNHGGPFPATGHPGFTAVGLPAAMLRFAALHSYDNVREHRLPPELQVINPTGSMWRRIDGEWTRADDPVSS